MALNGKYIGIERIVEGVFRDFGWTHEVDWVDILEWTGEVMDLIAAPKQYIDKVTDGDKDCREHPCPVVIDCYRGKLPCDLVYIVSVRDYDTKEELRYSSDLFHSGHPNYDKKLEELNPPRAPFDSPLQVTGAAIKSNLCDNMLTYTINDQHIFTNFEEGKVEIAYKAFPIDENGYPLIPDNVKYIQAVKHYIAEKMGQRLFIQGQMPGGIFQHLQRERDWYVGAATTAGLMPSIDEMESWKNQWLRLIPTINQHGTAFKYHGDRPQHKNHNSY
jgi:hypothetical protein